MEGSAAFRKLDKMLVDAYVAGDKDTMLSIAGTLALYAEERALEIAVTTVETKKEKIA